MTVQWAHLDAGVLIADQASARLASDSHALFGWAAPMSDGVTSDTDTTRQLLDGAIAAAARTAPKQAPPPAMTARRWAHHLVSQYHSSHHGVALLPELRDRFAAEGRTALAEFTERKRIEEDGHDRFAIEDLRRLGYDAEALVQAVEPEPSVTVGIDYARSCVRGPDPVEFLGYIYAQERRVLRLGEDFFDGLRRILPPQAEAFRGLRLHANSLDVAHVEDAVRFFSGRPAAERVAVARGAHRITRIRYASYPNRHPSETALAAMLDPYQREIPTT